MCVCADIDCVLAHNQWVPGSLVVGQSGYSVYVCVCVKLGSGGAGGNLWHPTPSKLPALVTHQWRGNITLARMVRIATTVHISPRELQRDREANRWEMKKKIVCMFYGGANNRGKYIEPRAPVISLISFTIHTIQLNCQISTYPTCLDGALLWLLYSVSAFRTTRHLQIKEKLSC